MLRKHNGRGRQLTDTTKNLRDKPIPGPHPGAGHPKRVVLNSVATPAEVRALLLMVLDADTANRMVLSLRKKIAKGNVGTLEFLFDRLIGRPAVNVHHDADGALVSFMSAWAELKAEAETQANLAQSPQLALDSASEVIDGDFMAAKSADNVEDAGTGI